MKESGNIPTEVLPLRRRKQPQNGDISCLCHLFRVVFPGDKEGLPTYTFCNFNELQCKNICNNCTQNMIVQYFVLRSCVIYARGVGGWSLHSSSCCFVRGKTLMSDLSELSDCPG